ncbi:hypothetical protein [Paenibacillus tundrae]
MINLEDQLNLLDEQIEKSNLSEDSEEYKALVQQRTFIYNDLVSCRRYVSNSQEYIAEQEVELRRIKREAEEGMLNSGRNKTAQEKREYAKFLIKDIIPRFEWDIKSTSIELHKRQLVLAGVPWPEAIKECQRMKDGAEDPEEALTLF